MFVKQDQSSYRLILFFVDKSQLIKILIKVNKYYFLLFLSFRMMV